MKPIATILPAASISALFAVLLFSGCDSGKNVPEAKRVTSIHCINYEDGKVLNDMVNPVEYDEKGRIVSYEGIRVSYISDNLVKGDYDPEETPYLLVNSFEMELKDGYGVAIGYQERPIPGVGIDYVTDFTGTFEHGENETVWKSHGVAKDNPDAVVDFSVRYVKDKKGRLKEVVFENDGVFSGRYVYEYGEKDVPCSDQAVCSSLFAIPTISTIDYILYTFVKSPAILKGLPVKCTLYKSTDPDGKPSVVKYYYQQKDGRIVKATLSRNGEPYTAYEYDYE